MRELFITCALLMLCSCAAVTHERVSGEDCSDGIRYYEASPFLLVYADGKGGLKWEIKMLPDPTKLMTASPTQVWSNLDTTMTFENGVLTSAKDIADASAVPKAVIAAVEKFLTASKDLVASAHVPPDQYFVPAPHLYRIVVNGNDITFHGGVAEPTVIYATVLKKE